MPQASDELRNVMKELFGDEVDDKGPRDYLLKKGFTQDGKWEWTAPAHGQVDCIDALCVKFLVDEWDEGGFKSPYSVKCVCAGKYEEVS